MFNTAGLGRPPIVVDKFSSHSACVVAIRGCSQQQSVFKSVQPYWQRAGGGRAPDNTTESGFPFV